MSCAEFTSVSTMVDLSALQHDMVKTFLGLPIAKAALKVIAGLQLCCAVLCRAVPCRAVPCRAVPCRAVQSYPVPRCAMLRCTGCAVLALVSCGLHSNSYHQPW